MKALFESIKNQFAANTETVRLCRAIFLSGGEAEGAPKTTLPQVLVIFRESEHTYAHGADMQTFSVVFRLHAKGVAHELPGNIDDQIDAIHRTYENVQLISNKFKCFECVPIAQSGPEHTDGRWVVDLAYRIRIIKTVVDVSLRYA